MSEPSPLFSNPYWDNTPDEPECPNCGFYSCTCDGDPLPKLPGDPEDEE
jgi:hypothetical protein